jgi:SAM-dependent methyltransferase
VIGKPHSDGFIDTVDTEASGIVRINAWTTGDPTRLLALRVSADGLDVPLSHWYRTYRPDVSTELDVHDDFLGVAIEYAFVAGPKRIDSLIIRLSDDDVFAGHVGLDLLSPAYTNLFSEARVLGRGEIYSHGSPSLGTSLEVLSVASTLPMPILDFGCGAGQLVRDLRSRGLEAHGIELLTPEVSHSLIKDVAHHVTLYDGKLPLPFPDKLFGSATLIDVIQHVDDFESVLREVCRLTREQVIVTVPDMSAVPLCAPHGVVPWHLLDGTQRQFFTQSSLSTAVRRYFRNFQILRIHPLAVNGTNLYLSLAARCWI